MGYKSKLAELYKESKEIECYPSNKLMFLGSDIFNFTTYDGAIDELFAKKMIEVIECILNKQTSEYHKHGENQANYLNYLTMVNMPFLADKLEWGTSIRSAWFDEYGHQSDKEKLYKITYDWKIPKADINKFFRELIEWVNE